MSRTKQCKEQSAEIYNETREREKNNQKKKHQNNEKNRTNKKKKSNGNFTRLMLTTEDN